MAKAFNGNLWNGIGTNIANRYALADAQRNQAMSNLGNTALGIEKMIANDNMKKDWMDYVKKVDERQQAAEEVKNAINDNTDENVAEMEADMAELDREDIDTAGYYDETLADEKKKQGVENDAFNNWMMNVDNTGLSPLQMLQMRNGIDDNNGYMAFWGV